MESIPRTAGEEGREGLATVSFSPVPTDITQLQPLMETAIRGAHTSSAYSQAQANSVLITSPALAFNFNVDVQAKVEVGGFLGVTLWLTFGVLLLSLWSMLNHVFTNKLNEVIADVGSQIINKSLPAQAGPITLSIPGLSPLGILGLRFELALTGTGVVSLLPFTCVPISLQQGTNPGQAPASEQRINVTFNKQSIELEDEEIRLGVRLA